MFMPVTVRKKKLANGEESLYLDCYDKGNRWKHFLDLRLTGDKNRDQEVMRLAEAARAQMQIDIFSGKHGLVDKSLGKLPGRFPRSCFLFLSETD